MNASFWLIKKTFYNSPFVASCEIKKGKQKIKEYYIFVPADGKKRAVATKNKTNQQVTN